MNAAIEALLRPRSIAILGASANFQKLNDRTLKALLDKGYASRIYPVNPKRFAQRKVGLVLTGGNIDPLTLAFIMERGLARSGRLARLTVELRDLPGARAQVTSRLATRGANIEEVHHQRTFTQLPLQTAEVEFVVQTRNHDYVREIIDALWAAGFNPRLQNGSRGKS